jgi:hypothetical protein
MANEGAHMKNIVQAAQLLSHEVSVGYGLSIFGSFYSTGTSSRTRGVRALADIVEVLIIVRVVKNTRAMSRAGAHSIITVNRAHAQQYCILPLISTPASDSRPP